MNMPGTVGRASSARPALLCILPGTLPGSAFTCFLPCVQG
jgi:hypothetical protein